MIKNFIIKQFQVKLEAWESIYTEMLKITSLRAFFTNMV